MTTKRLAELDELASQLEQRMAELRDELAAAQREAVSAAQFQRAVALFDPVWDLLLDPERFRILHLLLESVGYDGATGELELAFYPLGITSLAVPFTEALSGSGFPSAPRVSPATAPGSGLLYPDERGTLRTWRRWSGAWEEASCKGDRSRDAPPCSGVRAC